MSLERAQETMQRFFTSEHRDTSMMADDVVFTVMANGQEHHGRDGVQQMLQYFYRIAFDATAEARVTLVTESNALWEGEFIGRHIGEFAGIPATNRDVHVPLAVVYDLKDGQIKRGRVYIEMPVLIAQLTGARA